jgi:hypothetical protein
MSGKHYLKEFKLAVIYQIKEYRDALSNAGKQLDDK